MKNQQIANSAFKLNFMSVRKPALLPLPLPLPVPIDLELVQIYEFGPTPSQLPPPGGLRIGPNA